MEGGWRSRGLRACLVAGILLLGWGSLEVIRSSRLGTDEADLRRGKELLPLNAAYEQGLARQTLVAGNGGSAESHAAQAIRLFPFRGSLWLDLAAARLQQGNRDGVLEAVQKAVMLGPTKGKWRWRAAQVLLQAGWAREAAGELAAVARVDESRRYQAYDLAWTVFDDAQLIVEKVVPDTDRGRLDYLGYLMERHRPQAAIAVWPSAKKIASPEQRYAFIDFLLRKGAVKEAWSAWLETVPGARPGAIHNGDFDREPLGHGFGWRVANVDGVSAAVARAPGAAARSLEVRFSGGNPDFDHGYQIVPVVGGEAYRLSAEVRWEGVTSASRPHLYVRGYQKCVPLEAATGGFYGSGERFVVIDFVTPRECQAVVIGLRRRSSRKLDRSIRGTVWITSVELAVGRRPGGMTSRGITAASTDLAGVFSWRRSGGVSFLSSRAGPGQPEPRAPAA